MQTTTVDSGKARASWINKVGRRAPNAITLLRLLAVPVFVISLVNPTPQSSIWATAIFVVASITDWLDGYLARIFHAHSVLGTLLDPLADKILVMAALIMLAAMNREPHVPAWIVVALLSREMVVSGLRSLAGIRGTIVPAARWAKHKTAWTMLAIVFLLIHEPYTVMGYLVNFHFSGMVFLWIALFFSVITGYSYARELRSIWQESGTIP